jgi:phage/plasmid-like protein (TIGR03299 family)
MAHLLATTADGRNAIAYAASGGVPWHGLGQALTAGADIETWRREAGLDFTVLNAPVQFTNGELHTFEGRNVLYRSDTNKPLSVVSDKYRVVQPTEVLDFFKKLTESAGFELETAGVLDEGRKVWALAKVNDGAPIIGQDIVRPYVLLATSFDATLSTTAKFTAIRTVCNNTLTMAAGGTQGQSQVETDKTKGAVVTSVRVTHSERFDAAAVRQQLGIVLTAWDRFQVNARLLAEKELSPEDACELTYQLIEPTINPPKGQPFPDVRKTRNYRRIIELFSGEAIGYDLANENSAWQWVNCVSQLVDHERGRSASSRMNSAWFGTGEGLKNKALELALAV